MKNSYSIHKNFKLYIFSTVAGISISVFVCWLKDFSLALPRDTIFKILSDATFFSAVILMGLGFMVSISNAGLFIGVSYSMKRLSWRLSNLKTSKNKIENNWELPSYHDYRESRLETNISGRFMYIPGLLFLILSVIFIILYY